MKLLIDYTKILRSKNAGPMYVTFDIIFPDKTTMDNVIGCGIITEKLIADLYFVDVEDVDIIKYEIVNAIKITIPRKLVSGSIYDEDIYGCQLHMPLASIKVPL